VVLVSGLLTACGGCWCGVVVEGSMSRLAMLAHAAGEADLLVLGEGWWSVCKGGGRALGLALACDGDVGLAVVAAAAAAPAAAATLAAALSCSASCCSCACVESSPGAAGPTGLAACTSEQPALWGCGPGAC
jgi:hypothetical protein